MTASRAGTGAEHRRRDGLRGRPIIGLLLFTAAIALVVQEHQFRVVEATLTAPLVGLVLDGATVPNASSFYIGIGTEGIHRIVITSLCSTVVLFVPLLALTAVLTLLRRFRLGPVLTGFLLAAGIAAAANLTRYGLAAFALQTGGQAAFDLVHRWAGSLLVIVAFAVAVWVLVAVAARGSRGRP